MNAKRFFFFNDSWVDSLMTILSFYSQVRILDFGFSGTCLRWLGGPSQAFMSLVQLPLCSHVLL